MIRLFSRRWGGWGGNLLGPSFGLDYPWVTSLGGDFMWVQRTKAKRILFAVWLLLLRLFNILETQWNNSEKDELLELVPDALQGILDHVIPCVVTPGGYSIYPWVGRCGAAPHTLTLFKTNIADFPTLFKTEFRFLIPCLRYLSCLRQKLINRYPNYHKKW